MGKKRARQRREEQTAGCDSESRRSDSGTNTGFMLCCVVWALWDQAWKIRLDTLLTGLRSTRLFYLEIKALTVKSHFKTSQNKD